MTGYHISLGYNSGTNSMEDKEAWEYLKKKAKEICNDYLRIAGEAALFEKKPKSEEVFCQYAERYKDCTDSTIIIVEKDGIEGSEIMQLASGGGESRRIKEQLRRAFCRLVLREAHKKGIEINIKVC